MSTEPRTKLPLAGLLIVFVAPLASLMVIVPSLFAANVSPGATSRGAHAALQGIAGLPTSRQGVPRGSSGLGLAAPTAKLPARPATPGPAGPSQAPGDEAVNPLVTAAVLPAPAGVTTPVTAAAPLGSRSKHKGRRKHQDPAR